MTTHDDNSGPIDVRLFDDLLVAILTADTDACLAWLEANVTTAMRDYQVILTLSKCAAIFFAEVHRREPDTGAIALGFPGIAPGSPEADAHTQAMRLITAASNDDDDMLRAIAGAVVEGGGVDVVEDVVGALIGITHAVSHEVERLGREDA